MIFKTRYLDRNSETVWETHLNVISAEQAVATTVFFEWAPGANAVQILDPTGREAYLISRSEDLPPAKQSKRE